jgi:hypothetical protein
MLGIDRHLLLRILTAPVMTRRLPRLGGCDNHAFGAPYSYGGNFPRLYYITRGNTNGYTVVVVYLSLRKLIGSMPAFSTAREKPL